MAGVTRFVLTQDGQPNGVTRGHGTFRFNVSGIGVNRTKGVLATISEVEMGPSGQFDQPIQGDATMSVLNTERIAGRLTRVHSRGGACGA
jgi:hypothetical protein